MPADIRAAVPADVPAVLELWRHAAVQPTRTDDASGLLRLIEHDRGALLVAEDGGRVVGSVIAAWDGWRGTIYRLAVAPAERRKGLASALLSEAERRLAARGARRLQAVVVLDDARAAGFWRASDWQEQAGQLRFTRSP